MRYIYGPVHDVWYSSHLRAAKTQASMHRLSRAFAAPKHICRLRPIIDPSVHVSMFGHWKQFCICDKYQNLVHIYIFKCEICKGAAAAAFVDQHFLSVEL